jgi:hypothetical protein
MNSGINMTMNVSHLIEPTVKYYLHTTLQHCHENRLTIYYYVLNVGVLFLFTAIVGYVLYYCYTHKLSPQERQQKMIQEQQLVMEKIKFYQEEAKDRRMSDITNLPMVRDPMLYESVRRY